MATPEPEQRRRRGGAAAPTAASPVDEQLLTRFKPTPNLKRLEASQVGPYLDGLKARLGELYRLLLTADELGFHTPGDELVDSRPETGYFVGKLMAFVDCLRLKLRIHQLEDSPLSLSIDPTGSGFPHMRDLWFYNEDHTRARRELSRLDHDAIVAAARERIFAGQRPRREQQLKARHDYYRLLELSHHLRDFEVVDPQPLGQRGGRRIYRLDAYTLDGRYNLFRYLVTVFSLSGRASLDGRWCELRETHPSGALIEARLHEASLQPLGHLARHLQSVPGLDLHLIKRYTIGPYHCRHTDDQEPTRSLLEQHEATILRLHVEGLRNRQLPRPDAGGLLQRLLGDADPRLAHTDWSQLERCQLLLTPFRLKQVLGEHDEFDQPARIYGVTTQGEIVG